MFQQARLNCNESKTDESIAQLDCASINRQANQAFGEAISMEMKCFEFCIFLSLAFFTVGSDIVVKVQETFTVNTIQFSVEFFDAQKLISNDNNVESIDNLPVKPVKDIP